jgi:hypothetical protein
MSSAEKLLEYTMFFKISRKTFKRYPISEELAEKLLNVTKKNEH